MKDHLKGEKLRYLGNDTYSLGNRIYIKSPKTRYSPKKGREIVNAEIGYNLLKEKIRKSKKIKEKSYKNTLYTGILAAVEYGCFGKAYNAFLRAHNSVCKTATGAALFGLAAMFTNQGLEHLLKK